MQKNYLRRTFFSHKQKKFFPMHEKVDPLILRIKSDINQINALTQKLSVAIEQKWTQLFIFPHLGTPTFLSHFVHTLAGV